MNFNIPGLEDVAIMKVEEEANESHCMYNCLNVRINVQFVKKTSKVHDYRI